MKTAQQGDPPSKISKFIRNCARYNSPSECFFCCASIVRIIEPCPKKTINFYTTQTNKGLAAKFPVEMDGTWPKKRDVSVPCFKCLRWSQLLLSASLGILQNLPHHGVVILDIFWHMWPIESRFGLCLIVLVLIIGKVLPSWWFYSWKIRAFVKLDHEALLRIAQLK